MCREGKTECENCGEEFSEYSDMDEEMLCPDCMEEKQEENSVGEKRECEICGTVFKVVDCFRWCPDCAKELAKIVIKE